jgi:hypothetical protein
MPRIRQTLSGHCQNDKLGRNASRGHSLDKVKGSMARYAMSIIQYGFGNGESGVVFAQFRSVKDSFVQACKEMGIEL